MKEMSKNLSFVLGLCATPIFSASSSSNAVPPEEIEQTWSAFLTSCQNNSALKPFKEPCEKIHRILNVELELLSLDSEHHRLINEAKVDMGSLQARIDYLRGEDRALNDYFRNHCPDPLGFISTFWEAIKSHLKTLPRSAALDLVEREILSSSRTPNETEQVHVQKLVDYLKTQQIDIQQVRVFDGESLGLGELPPNESDGDFLHVLSEQDYTKGTVYDATQKIQTGCNQSPICRDMARLCAQKGKDPLPFTERLDVFCQRGYAADKQHSIRFLHDPNHPLSRICGRDIFNQERQNDLLMFSTPGDKGCLQDFRVESWVGMFHEMGHILDKISVLSFFDHNHTSEQLSPLMQTLSLKVKSVPRIAFEDSWTGLWLDEILQGAPQGTNLDKLVSERLPSKVWDSDREFWNIVGLGLVELNGKLTLCINKLSEWALFASKGLPTRWFHLNPIDDQYLNEFLSLKRNDDIFKPLLEVFGVNFNEYQQKLAQAGLGS